KTIAIAVHAQAPDDEVFSCGCLGNSVTIGVLLEKLAAACQAIKTLVMILALVAMNAKFTDQLLESGCALGLAFDFLQNSGVRKHWSEGSPIEILTAKLAKKPWNVELMNSGGQG